MHKIFRYPITSETLKGCPRFFSALRDQKVSTGKRDITLFIQKFFWNQELSQKQKDTLTKVFGTLSHKNFDWNSGYAPLIPKFLSVPQKFRKSEKFLYKAFNFGPVRRKFLQYGDAPLPYACKFTVKDFFETPKYSPMKYFGTVRQKRRRKNVILPPSHPNFFDTRD